MGLLSNLIHSDQNGILDKYTYTYDNMLNKTSIEKYRRGLEEESGRYEYTYDALNRLTAVSKDDTMIKTFGYDPFGNRSFMTDTTSKTNYTYNALNQLMHLENSIMKQDFTYDKRGNLTQILENDSVKNTYEFSPLNRLTKATNANGQVSHYDYNGLGFRVGKTIADDLNPTKKISYVLDLTKQYHNLLQKVEDGSTQSFAWDNNVAFADGNAYLQDELGSPLRYLDTTGTLIDSYGYDEFGGDLYGNQGLAQPFGFTGYMADSVAQTYFAQAREYNPTSGRFVSRDLFKGQINIPLTLNEYSYCINSPLVLVDMDGNMPDWLSITLGVLAVAGAVALTVVTFGASAPLAVVATAAVVGTVVGAGIETYSQYKQNNDSFENLDVGKIVVSGVQGGLSGVLSTTGIGLLGQAFGNGIIGGVGSALKGDSALDVAINTLIGSIAGLAGGPGTGRGGLHFSEAIRFKELMKGFLIAFAKSTVVSNGLSLYDEFIASINDTKSRLECRGE